MKRKLLLALGLLLSASFVKGQFSPFNRTINVNLNRGVSPANDTTALGIVSPPSKYYESPLPSSLTSIQGRFFPNITDGSLKLRAISYQPSAEFKLNGDILSIKNPTTSIAKVAAFSIANADPIVKFKFTIDLTTYTGANAFAIAFGNTAAPSTLTSISSPFTSAADIFGAFRVVISGSNMVTQYRPLDGLVGGVATAQVNTATPYLIKAGLSQVVEVFANSTAAASSYTYGVNTVNIPANTYHVYVDGVKYAEDFPKASSTYTQSTINAISFAYSGGTTQQTINLSNISVTYPSATLPVSLTSFTGENTASGIRLNWKTASEQNNSHFELLRAGEDKNFKFISRISGKGNSDVVQNYSFNDESPLNGNNYYQLKQVDFDGTETIFNQLVAVKSSLNNQSFKVSVSEESVLNAHIYASSPTSAKIAVYDMSGRKLFEEQVSLQEGNNIVSKAIPAIQTGVYVARVLANGLNAQTKFVKK
ncbi:T9SS type A sorting domain-containing protein [Pedobacter aquae]|uniref:T9SS type A sorting domain-containing protein n=1 Tax=Pedobacter aquae TaxID=2605747 RepID=A0A5C0VKD0_9SPHI|nr:T9SS type A sorting domain-containing protein [Pedobacter aquae]QEK51404.1 T9SS type A sorting domain-containing protein [Pedobacter aquae]